jgi:release factor glutamine methyltransferase
MTAGEALRAATRRLAAAGVEGAARDARWLLAHVLGVDPGVVGARLDEALAAEAAAAFEAAVQAREARQPVSQITGRREFWGRDFLVTPDVLDPRADTETLISEALSDRYVKILDLGTGSGAILVTLLAERPLAQGLGTDISDAALAVARSNADRHGVDSRARFQNSDWFDAVEGRFDLIVSNPPYIAADEMPGLEPEVRLWEPALTLTDHADGLTAYRAIARRAPARLMAGGRLLVEIGATQSAAVAQLFRSAGLEDIATHPDLEGRDRVVSARKP